MDFTRKICVVTGTRAEYGLLRNLVSLINDCKETSLQLVVTGTHLVEEFGFTINHIIEDGFYVNKKIEMLLANDSTVSVTKSMGLALLGFSDAFDELKPDIIILLGDRYEMLAAASAALIAGIPVAHIHGGEVTEGAIDDSIRHSITKMSYLHFASTEEYRKRIIQLGEEPERVFNVGAPGLDNIDKLELLSVNELSKSMKCELSKPYAVVTYHPVTLPYRSNLEAIDELMKALKEFSEMQFIITYPNADTYGRQIIDKLKEFSRDNENIILVNSLGQLRYLSAIKNAEFVLGNSSSGIIEVPSFGIPTINIGDRQKGRIYAESVIHCDDNHKSIIRACNIALSSKFKAIAGQVKNPYKQENTSSRIFNYILNTEINRINRKAFFNIDFDELDLENKCK
ncbi:MAG: UDP-N-acetylglucosamine 2-epimerase [Emcibacteraceae bacterium]